MEGNNPRMVRNSIGVSTCDGAGNWNIDYVKGMGGGNECAGFRFRPRMILRNAPRLTGPWTEGKAIYQIPDMQPNAPLWTEIPFATPARSTLNSSRRGSCSSLTSVILCLSRSWSTT